MFQIANRRFVVPIIIAVSLLIFGAFIKIMHWPFALWFFIIGSTSLIIFYLLRFLSKPEKFFLDYVKLALVISYVARVIFYIFHIPGKTNVSIIFLIIVGLYAVLTGIPYITDLEVIKSAIKSKNYPILIKTFFAVLGTFSIVAGSVFKVMHWPGSDLMLIGGLIVIAIWAMVDLLFAKE